MATMYGVRLPCTCMRALLVSLWVSAMTTATFWGGRNISAQREFDAK